MKFLIFFRKQAAKESQKNISNPIYTIPQTNNINSNNLRTKDSVYLQPVDTTASPSDQGLNLYSSVDYGRVSRSGSQLSLIINSTNNSPNVRKPSPLSVNNATYNIEANPSGGLNNLGNYDNNSNTYQQLPPSSFNSEYSTLSDLASNTIDGDEPLYREVYSDTPYASPYAEPDSTAPSRIEPSLGGGNYQSLNVVPQNIYQ